ncbi:hypothetical protein CBOM_07573 [Ceraceosorus bombacis]|uniref:Uncharacterized protein n=1 Tax=Ceraceosorus bombacis TaxID=401625 RepID=A0A0P1B924_9BASI|nr:hypothetical protein CBOM_07573 [Ceraceosorus bombacis]
MDRLVSARHDDSIGAQGILRLQSRCFDNTSPSDSDPFFSFTFISSTLYSPFLLLVDGDLRNASRGVNLIVAHKVSDQRIWRFKWINEYQQPQQPPHPPPHS